jgi:hypothetical protein
MWQCEVDSSGSNRGRVAGSFEHSDKHAGFINVTTFFD